MKKHYLLISFLIGFLGFAQCNILGNSQIQLGQTATYSIENDNAQCNDCHLWVTVGGNSMVDGEFRKNSVNIRPTSGGRTILSLSVLTAQGLSQCSKNIDIIDKSSKSSELSASNCDINISDFRERKVSEGIVSFFPEQTENKYKYQWFVEYLNGDKKESVEQTPNFPYSAENPITSVKMKVNSSKCFRNYSKMYENNFWKFFN